MGDWVELGVGNGKYAEKLAQNNLKKIWAYDTFDGKFPLETVGDGENPEMFTYGGQSSNPDVRYRLETLGIKCVTGLFPESFHNEHPESVNFVHVDMDTYSATKSALELFHPLMEPCGVFMVHDYDNKDMPGVKKAVDEFVSSDIGKLYATKPSYEGHYMLVR